MSTKNNGKCISIYAKIMKNSKYYLQNQYAKPDGEFPLPVKIQGFGEEYCVKGSPGGQYRLSDVNLFIIDKDQEIRISYLLISVLKFADTAIIAT